MFKPTNQDNPKSLLNIKRNRGPNENINTQLSHTQNQNSFIPESPHSNHNTKQEKINKIINNFAQMDNVIKREDIKKLYDNVAKFSIDDFSKLFQNIANHEFTSLKSKNSNTKEPITINMNMITFDPEDLDNDNIDNNNNNPQEDISDIDQIIIKNSKENENIKEKIRALALSPSINQKNIPAGNSEAIFDIKKYFESITQNMKNIINDQVINIPSLKNIIKLYSTFVHSNNQLSQNEDKLLLSLILEVGTLSSTNDFFELCNYWLYTEYLIASKERDYYRYNTLLDEIILLIENTKVKHPSFFESDFKSWVIFMSHIPRYTKRFIDHIIIIHDTYFKTHYTFLKQMSFEKKKFEDQLPYLTSMKQIYIEIVNGRKIDANNKIDCRDKLLINFIQMTRNDYNHLNARAIEFLFNSIYNISRNIDLYEETKIKQYAIDGLKELLKINKDSTEDEHLKKNFIEERFPLYLHLCKKENEVLKELPEVYASCSPIVKQIFDKYMKLMINNMTKFKSKQLVTKCNDNCEEIIIAIIETTYKSSIKMTEKINDDEGLFTKIGSYYAKYSQLSKGLIILSSKIPIADFFSKDNFLLGRLKGNNDEFSMKIMNCVNNNDNVNIYDFDMITSELLSVIENKIVLYLAYYYLHCNEIIRPANDNTLNIFIEYYIDALETLMNEEDKAIKELDRVNEVMIGLKVNMSVYILLFQAIIDYAKNYKEGNDQLIEVLYEKMSYYLNEMNKNEPDLFNDVFYENFINFIKNDKQQNSVIKERLLMKLNENIKTSLQGKDLILFGDL